MKGGKLAINPDNNKQARVFYCFEKAGRIGERRHPQTVMKDLSVKFGFKVLWSVPQSLFDGWDFWIEFDDEPELPDYFRANIPWTPVGQA